MTAKVVLIGLLWLAVLCVVLIKVSDARRERGGDLEAPDIDAWIALIRETE